jgi:microcystin-dependent protein
MILLTSVNDRLQVVASAAGALHCHTTWVDTAAAVITPGRANTVISAAATVSVAGTPPASTQRNIKTLHIHNVTGTGVPTNVTVQHTDGTTTVQLYKCSLLPGDSLEYTDQGGFSLGGSAATGWTTGDIRVTLNNFVPAGWILMTIDGSIGDATSGATNRANADTRALFKLLYGAIVPALVLQDSAGVTVTRGASADADFDAHRRLMTPKLAGRALAGAGNGTGLTSRALGAVVGGETVSQDYNTMAQHTHLPSGVVSNFIGLATVAENNWEPSGSSHFASCGVEYAGLSQPMNNMQPTTFVALMMKL